MENAWKVIISIHKFGNKRLTHNAPRIANSSSSEQYQYHLNAHIVRRSNGRHSAGQ